MTIKLNVTLKKESERWGIKKNKVYFVSFRGILRYLDTNRQSYERAASLNFSSPWLNWQLIGSIYIYQYCVRFQFWLRQQNLLSIYSSTICCRNTYANLMIQQLRIVYLVRSTIYWFWSNTHFRCQFLFYFTP